MNRTQKTDTLKSDVLSRLKINSDEYNNRIVNSIEVFNNKNLGLEKITDNLLNNLPEEKELIEYRIKLSDILSKLRSNIPNSLIAFKYSDIPELKYERKAVNNVVEMPKNVVLNDNSNINNAMNNGNNVNNENNICYQNQNNRGNYIPNNNMNSNMNNNLNSNYNSNINDIRKFYDNSKNHFNQNPIRVQSNQDIINNNFNNNNNNNNAVQGGNQNYYQNNCNDYQGNMNNNPQSNLNSLNSQYLVNQPPQDIRIKDNNNNLGINSNPYDNILNDNYPRNHIDQEEMNKINSNFHPQHPQNQSNYNDFSLLPSLPNLLNNDQVNIQDFNRGNSSQNNRSLPLNNYYNANKKTIEAMIGFKNKCSELIVFSKNKFYYSKLEQNYFQDKNNSFSSYPELTKYVNLGQMILLTGGNLNRQVSSNCYQIIIEINKQDECTQTIINYDSMKEKRDRHNIIHLYNIESVLVCSGFNSKTAEMTNLNKGFWETIPSLNDIRSNATMAYINDRFVYCIGGFKPVSKVGSYQNSLEILDIKNINNGWRIVDFTGKFQTPISYSTMGVLNMSNDKIYLLGGYDGVGYLNSVSEFVINSETGDVENYFVKKNILLPQKQIFVHNQFIRLEENAINIDFHASVAIFNPNTENITLTVNQKK